MFTATTSVTGHPNRGFTTKGLKWHKQKSHLHHTIIQDIKIQVSYSQKTLMKICYDLKRLPANTDQTFWCLWSFAILSGRGSPANYPHEGIERQHGGLGHRCSCPYCCWLVLFLLGFALYLPEHAQSEGRLGRYLHPHSNTHINGVTRTTFVFYSVWSNVS